MFSATGACEDSNSKSIHTFYLDGNKWQIVIGKYSRKQRFVELQEFRKILIYGVNRDTDLWCINKWLFELSLVIELRKIVSKGVCRIKVICKDVQSREFWFEEISVRCKNLGWHATRGRTSRIRKLARIQKQKNKGLPDVNRFATLVGSKVNKEAAEVKKSSRDVNLQIVQNPNKGDGIKRKYRKRRKKRNGNLCSKIVIAAINIQVVFKVNL